MRLVRALRSACGGFELQQLAPRSRYGAPGWQRELLKLYDGDAVKRLKGFLRSVRWRQLHSHMPTPIGLFYNGDQSAKRLARRIVFALNYFGLEFQQCFRLVLLREVAFQIHKKRLRPELWVGL